MELPDGKSGTDSKLLSDCPPSVWTAWSARGTTRRLAALAGTIPRSLFMALLERPPPAASCLSSCLLSFSSFLIFSLLFHFFLLSVCFFLTPVPPSLSYICFYGPIPYPPPTPQLNFLNSFSSSNQCPCSMFILLSHDRWSLFL